MSENGNGGFDFFKGFLFGGLVGAVVTILYAPKSGKEVREDMRKRSHELSDDAQERLNMAQERAEQLLTETTKQIQKLREEARTAVEEGKGKVTEQKKRVQGAVDAGVDAYKKEKSTKSKKS